VSLGTEASTCLSFWGHCCGHGEVVDRALLGRGQHLQGLSLPHFKEAAVSAYAFATKSRL
jgi:predicted aconitase with swiveling domain